MSLLRHATKPCASCPWVRANTAADIPSFSLELAESLAECCPNENGMGPDFDAKLFACHKSAEGAEFACAGWLASVGRAHPMVRLAVMMNELDVEALAPGKDWPDMHETYPDVLQKLQHTRPPGRLNDEIYSG